MQRTFPPLLGRGGAHKCHCWNWSPDWSRYPLWSHLLSRWLSQVVGNQRSLRAFDHNREVESVRMQADAPVVCVQVGLDPVSSADYHPDAEQQRCGCFNVPSPTSLCVSFHQVPLFGLRICHPAGLNLVAQSIAQFSRRAHFFSPRGWQQSCSSWSLSTCGKVCAIKRDLPLQVAPLHIQECVKSGMDPQKTKDRIPWVSPHIHTNHWGGSCQREGALTAHTSPAPNLSWSSWLVRLRSVYLFLSLARHDLLKHPPPPHPPPPPAPFFHKRLSPSLLFGLRRIFQISAACAPPKGHRASFCVFTSTRGEEQTWN